MAVSGTVPAPVRSAKFDASRTAKRLRRATWIVAVSVFTWFLLKFGTRWVPPGMDTVPDAPAGSWCIVDRWSGGLRVGSDVFVDTPSGTMVSRVVALDADTVTVEHPNASTTWPDSRSFGPLPRQNVLCTVMVVFAPAGTGGDRRGR